jgi:hypothetical protein
MSVAERRMMGWRTPWALPGHWFRGALHIHTTNSDGALDPAAAIAWYREHRYDFAAISDHRVVTDVSGLGDDTFLVLPGIELSAGRTEIGGDYHILGLGVTREPALAAEASAQDAINAVREAGGEAVIAHPYWSGAVLGDLLPLEGYLAVEVFNSTCEESIAKGLSAVHWDELLARGRRLWGLAVDDAHWRRPDHGEGWIVLKARWLTREAVMRALRDGHFYSTRGPRITGIEVVEGVVRVTCSAAATVTFVCENWRGKRFHAAAEAGISRAEFVPPPEAIYVRVECADRQGRVAWSNPIYLTAPSPPAPSAPDDT